MFTTDGELANRMMHPSYQVEREYAVRVFGEVNSKMLSNLQKGVELEDGMAKFSKITASQEGNKEAINRWYNVVLQEGRKREVRRLWESQDVTVSRLLRIRYGDINLPRNLKQEQSVELSLEEVNQLRTAVKMPEYKMDKVEVSPKLTGHHKAGFNKGRSAGQTARRRVLRRRR
jgi:23S rRNA pseudouridine2605 synthase